MQQPLRFLLLAIGILGFSTPSHADVPFVPTPQEVVNAMLQTAQVGPGDFVLDLGSGDGRIVITAARDYGARGLGVDRNPDLVARSRKAAEEAGVSDRARFVQGDLFETDLSQATVLTMYLLPGVNRALRPKLLSDLRPGTRIVSHAFDLDDWEPDAKQTIRAGGTNRQVYAWIVPARIDGEWKLTVGDGTQNSYRLALDQKFQRFDGRVETGGDAKPIRDGRLVGEAISFTLPGQGGGQQIFGNFQGHVNGGVIEGSVVAQNGQSLPARAIRVQTGERR